MAISPEENEHAALSEWKKRSETLGDAINGVLFKGLPDVVNQHIHEGHLEWIAKHLGSAGDISILDVGCGYGRVSEAVLARRSNAAIHGVDFIENYAAMYRRRTGKPAFVGSAAHLPCRAGQYDAVICVTVLMYLHDDIVADAIAQLLSTLKPGGTLLLIEPDATGKPFQTAFGIRGLFAKRKPAAEGFATGGKWFKDRELSAVITARGGAIVAKGSLPVTTLLFLPLFVAAKLLPAGFMAWGLKRLRRLDRLCQSIPAPSLYKMYAVRRAE